MRLFDRFGKKREIEHKQKGDSVQEITNPWGRGYKILNRYEIIDIKKGGMGVVYIAQDHEWDRTFAIKTFQDKYFWDEDVIQRFITEAEIWTKLERHTNIVFANFVERVEGKPLVFLDYINGGDLNQFIGKLSIIEVLDFAIQFCTGMDYAYQKLGVIHRDIKPGNILVQKDSRFKSGYLFKVTDFGLVKSLGDKFQDEFVDISSGIGTLPFMPPEQFPKRIQEKFSFKGEITTRTDVYSFGVTLYSLLTGKMPFEKMDAIFTLHPKHPKNLNPKVPENLDILITKCIEKNPEIRYKNFTELQKELIEIYNDTTGESYTVIGERGKLTETDWSNKGVALFNLGKTQEAIECYDKSLEINPLHIDAWTNKGTSLEKLGKYSEAIECYDKSLEINPRIAAVWDGKGIVLDDLKRFQEAIECFDNAIAINPRDTKVWNNKGNALGKFGKFQEGIRCYDNALAINPRDIDTWTNKGTALEKLGKYSEAIECFDKTIEINPKTIEAWNGKGIALRRLGKILEAIECFDKALVINTQNRDAWNNKGNALSSLGKYQEAIECYNKALEIDPRYANGWNNKGASLDNLGNHQEALVCYNKTLEIYPKHAGAWHNKGTALFNLGRYQEAIECYDEALEINPRDPNEWYAKGSALHNLGRYQEAIECYDKALEINPIHADAWNNKGIALKKLGRYSEADAAFKAARAQGEANLIPSNHKEECKSINSRDSSPSTSINPNLIKLIVVFSKDISLDEDDPYFMGERKIGAFLAFGFLNTDLFKYLLSNPKIRERIYIIGINQTEDTDVEKMMKENILPQIPNIVYPNGVDVYLQAGIVKKGQINGDLIVFTCTTGTGKWHYIKNTITPSLKE
jgi:tetratricopeptide (TPR) repeat protein